MSAILQFVFPVMQCMAGITLNSWIIIANLKDWMKGIRLSPCDHIHLSMGLCNIILQCVLVLFSTTMMFWTHVLYDNNGLAIFLALIIFLVYTSFWLSSWLCVYFCISIVNFSCPLLIWLKKHISKLLVASAMQSLLIGVPSFWLIQLEEEISGNATFNSIVSYKLICLSTLYERLSAILGSFLPFAISLLSIGITVISLLRHIQRVKQNSSGFSHSLLQAHFRAAITMTLLMLLCITFYVAQSFAFEFSSNYSETLIAVCWVLIVSIPTSESLIIIHASPKLKKIFLVRCCAEAPKQAMG